jgi:hypothetical protein
MNFLARLLEIAAIYAGCGAVVAGLFLTRWRRTFDPSAAAGSWGFCVLVVPGIVALWPLVLSKVWRGRRDGGVESPVSAERLRHHHAVAFVVLAIVAPLLFAVALIWRAPEIPRNSEAHAAP